MDALKFLSFLFEEKGDEQHILIWTAPNKLSRFFKNINEASEYIASVGSDQNVYCGVGIHDKATQNGRGRIGDIYGIPAIWVDIDIQDDAHQKQNLPPSIDDVMEILDAQRWSPSIVVNTGHGLHAYYRFREPIWLTNDNDRKEASVLVQKFQGFIRSIFKSRGWTLDSTHDLARVMRVPGSFNIKREPYAQAKILLIDESLLYNPGDFHDLPDLEVGNQISNSDIPVDIGSITLDPQANPPFNKLEALLENNINFKQSWEHKRKNFPSGDYSQSAYDQSLATLAAITGWTDQEIANLVIANRSKFRVDLKLRKDYYTSLLLNARKSVLKMKAHNDIEHDLSFREAQSVGTDGKVRTTVEGTEAVWETYSNMWGFRIQKVVRTLGDPPTFHIDTDHGRIDVGSSENIISQKIFGRLVADRTKILIDEEKRTAWRKIARFLIMSAIDEDFGVEATDIGLITAWIGQYLDTHKPVSEESERYEATIESRNPFMRDNQACFFLDEFRGWIIAARREPIRRSRLIQLLGMIQCSTMTIHVGRKLERTTRHVWVMPPATQLHIKQEEPTKSQPQAELPEVDF